MKTTLKIVLSVFAAMVLLSACSSNDDTAPMPDDDVSITDDVDPTDDGTPDSSDGQITFPEGTDIDLTGASVTIAGEVIPVMDLQNIALPTFDGANELAFLTNADDNILLMGFIGEGREELSIASTAEVLFYFSTTAYLQPSEITGRVLDEIKETAEYLAFVETLESSFISDNLVIQNLDFLDALESQIQQLLTVETVNPNNAIFVESNDVRSELQLNRDGNENSFNVKNNGPRRAQLFAYKKAFTDMDGNRTVLIDEVGPGQQSEFNEKLYEGRFNREKFTDVQVNENNLLYVLVGCGNFFLSTTSEPYELELSDNESIAEYEISIVGPGQNQGQRDFSNSEREAFENISEETFFLDFVLPTLFEIAGRKQDYDKIQGSLDESVLTALIAPYLETNSTVRGLIYAGEFNSALSTFFQDTLSNQSLFQILEEVYNVVYSDENVNGSFVFTDELSENLANMVEIIAGITNRLSFNCTDNYFDDIAIIESWDITVDRGDVSLEPLRGGVQTLEDLEITAIVEGFEEEELSNGSIIYEWTVSENFSSILRDSQGNNGVTFTNTTNTVIYQSSASGADLFAFENLETVTVRAFRDNNGSPVLIGTAEMTVNVQERKFVVDPIDVILCGIEQANLRVLNESDNTPLAANNNFDFRLVWTTSGAHALFNGNSTSETVLNDNGIVLRNLDDDVENATQRVRVGIWLRPKDNPNDLPFREAGFAFVDVFISNTDTVEFEVAAEDFIAFSAPEGNGTRLVLGGGFLIPKDPRATSYRAEIVEYFFDGNRIENLSGATYTWTNQSQSEPVFDADNINNTFAIVFNSASVNTAFPGFGDIKSQFDGVSGRAKITIDLKN